MGDVRPVGICDILFLNARKMAADVGTLLVSLESGLIQVWTHHPGAGFFIAFSVIHEYRDCAKSLATDPENEFLITGLEIRKYGEQTPVLNATFQFINNKFYNLKDMRWDISKFGY